MPTDHQVIHNVAQILELSVPKMEHPSESFLAQLEEDLSKLILKHGMTVCSLAGVLTRWSNT